MREGSIHSPGGGGDGGLESWAANPLDVDEQTPPENDGRGEVRCKNLKGPIQSARQSSFSDIIPGDNPGTIMNIDAHYYIRAALPQVLMPIITYAQPYPRYCVRRRPGNRSYTAHTLHGADTHRAIRGRQRRQREPGHFGNAGSRPIRRKE